MTEEQRVLLKNLLGHQIKGIMFHSDCFAYYLEHDNKRMKLLHYNQVMEETQTHLNTVCKIYHLTNEMIEPAFTQANKLILSDNPIQQWQEWEEGALACYEKALEYFQNCTYFQVLVRKVNREIRRIKSLTNI